MNANVNAKDQVKGGHLHMTEDIKLLINILKVKVTAGIQMLEVIKIDDEKYERVLSNIMTSSNLVANIEASLAKQALAKQIKEAQDKAPDEAPVGEPDPAQSEVKEETKNENANEKEEILDAPNN